MLSKTVEWGKSMNVDDVALLEGEDTGWWAKWDEKYFAPFFRYIFMYSCSSVAVSGAAVSCVYTSDYQKHSF